jgi:hypothetical protein
MNRRLALIIGSSEYEDAKLARLRTPDMDVSNLAEVLSDPEVGGFDEVIPLINQSSLLIRRAIARLFAEKKPDDLLLLFFSGHGVRDDNGDLYLAVKDTESDLLSATAIPAAFITAEMDRSRSRRQILILDCCHSGAFARGTKGAPGLGVGTAAAFQGNGYGRIVLTASDSTQYAWEGDQVIGQPENSVFTHYLVRGLKTGEADADADGRITLDELFDYVYGQVVNKTPKQTPGKWAYKQQGEIIIARNPRPVLKPAELPAELLQAIENPIPSVREGAVRELERLLHSSHKGVAITARNALKRLSDDDSRRVSAAAVTALAACAETEILSVAQSEQWRLRAEPPMTRRPTKTEPPAPGRTGEERGASDIAAASRWAAEKVNAEQNKIEKASARPVKNMAWLSFALVVLGLPILLLGLILGNKSSILAFPLFTVGAIGILGSIGLLMRQTWGRQLGLVFSLLFEMAGLVSAVAIVTILCSEPQSVASNEVFAAWAGAAIVSMSVGIILSFRLSRESVVLGLGGDLKHPAGVLPIAIPMLLTVVGAKPALDLLRNRNSGRTGMIAALAIFAPAWMFGTIVAGSRMRQRVYYGPGGYISIYSNETGFAIAMIDAVVVGIWCGIGIFYLKSAGVKTWFQK